MDEKLSKKPPAFPLDLYYMWKFDPEDPKRKHFPKFLYKQYHRENPGNIRNMYDEEAENWLPAMNEAWRKYADKCIEKRDDLLRVCSAADVPIEDKIALAKTAYNMCRNEMMSYENLYDFMREDSGAQLPVIRVPPVDGKSEGVDTFAIFSYNVNMFPENMPGAVTGANRLRIEPIVGKIEELDRKMGFDVLVFTELFGAPRTRPNGLALSAYLSSFPDLMINKLTKTYPFNSNDEWEKKSQNPKRKDREEQRKTWLNLGSGIQFAVKGAKEFFSGEGIKALDSGVVIFSKNPIIKVDILTYDAPMIDEDSLAEKGAVHVQVLKGGKNYHVIGTHPMSGDSDDVQQVKLLQYRELERWILELEIPHDEAVFIAGDLNIDRFKQHHKVEYRKIMSRLNASMPEVATTIDEFRQCSVLPQWELFKEKLNEIRTDKKHRDLSALEELWRWRDYHNLPRTDPSLRDKFAGLTTQKAATLARWKSLEDKDISEKTEKLEERGDNEVRPQWTICKNNDLENNPRFRTEWLDYVLFLLDYRRPIKASLWVATDFFFGRRPFTPRYGAVHPVSLTDSEIKERRKAKQLIAYRVIGGIKWTNDLSDHYPVFAVFEFDKKSASPHPCGVGPFGESWKSGDQFKRPWNINKLARGGAVPWSQIGQDFEIESSDSNFGRAIESRPGRYEKEQKTVF